MLTRPLLSRIAGGLGLAYVVLLMTGLFISGGGALLEEGAAGVERAYRDGALAPILTGWFIESVGFILFVPAAVFLASRLGRTSEAGRWAARSGLVFAGLYVAATLAVGFPAGAAAAYGTKEGLAVEAAVALNSMRVFAYLLSLLALGGQVVCVALSALSDGIGRRWVGLLGLVTGVALCASAPLAVASLHDLPTLLYLVWWVGVCVLLLRARLMPSDPVAAIPAPTPALRHA